MRYYRQLHLLGKGVSVNRGTDLGVRGANFMARAAPHEAHALDGEVTLSP